MLNITLLRQRSIVESSISHNQCCGSGQLLTRTGSGSGCGSLIKKLNDFKKYIFLSYFYFLFRISFFLIQIFFYSRVSELSILTFPAPAPALVKFQLRLQTNTSSGCYSYSHYLSSSSSFWSSSFPSLSLS